ASRREWMKGKRSVDQKVFGPMYSRPSRMPASSSRAATRRCGPGAGASSGGGRAPDAWGGSRCPRGSRRRRRAARGRWADHQLPAELLGRGVERDGQAGHAPLQALLAHGGGVLGGAGVAQGAEASEIGVHASEAVGGREVDGAGMVEVEPERAGREGREHGGSFIGVAALRLESSEMAA